VVEVRGRGLIQGVVLDGPASTAVARARELGLLVVTAGPQVVRLLPPLNVTEAELDEGVALLEEALR
jgi:acetylornithine/succinyldiaminopimelate/putrescine aminotransferase